MESTLAREPRRRGLTGDLPAFAADPLGFLTRTAHDQGAIARLRFGRTTAFLVSDPVLIEEVMVTRRNSYVKARPLLAQSRLFGNGLLTNEGDSWLTQRRLAQPAFHRAHIASYARIMVDATHAMLNTLADRPTTDIHQDLKRLTIGIVASALFGSDVSSRTDDLSSALEASMDRYASRRGIARFVPDWVPLSVNRRYHAGIDDIDSIIAGMISRRRASAEQHTDLLSMLLNARDEDGGRMDDRQLRDEAITLFVGGFDTPALALSWAWSLLATHPEVQTKLFDEVDSVLGRRDATVSDLPRLSYTDAVIKEVLRLYPPAWLISRDAIENTTIGNQKVRRGSSVLISQWVMHRSARHFESPADFLPERWLRDPSPQLPRAAYFPFGLGPRVCIGASFATMEMTFVLATIAQRMKFVLAPEARLDAWPTMTLRPRYGVDVKLDSR